MVLNALNVAIRNGGTSIFWW